MLKKTTHRLKKIIEIIFTFIQVKTRKKNKKYNGAILFSSHSHKYSDNSKHLYEHLRAKGYNVYYITDNQSCIDRITPKSQEFYRALKCCTAVCFTHTEEDISFYIPKPVIRINLWHGSPIKKMGFDSTVDSKWLKKYSLIPRKNPYQRWDYIVIQSDLFKNAFISALQFGEHKILNFGLPRNDALGCAPPELISKIYSELGINGQSKNILYAPTFRDSEFDIISICETLKEVVTKLPRTKLLIRLHPFDKSKVPEGFYTDMVINANRIDDTQDLLNIADTLITDYSSIAFDYACLDRKIILYCPDHLEYAQARGGLYFEPKELPFIYCTNIQDAENALLIEGAYKYSTIYPQSQAKIHMENFLLTQNLLFKSDQTTDK